MVDVGDIADDAVDAAQEAGKDAAEAVGLEEEVDAAEDRFQGATGIDLGGSGGGRNNPDVKKQGEEDPGNTLNDSGGSSGSGNDVMPGGKDPSVNDPSDGSDPSVSGSNGGGGNTASFESTTVEEEKKRDKQERVVEEKLMSKGERVKAAKQEFQRDREVFNIQRRRRDPSRGAVKDLVDPNESVGNGQFTTSGELVLAGQDIISESEKFGNRVERNVPRTDVIGSGIGGTIAAAELAGRGQVKESAEAFLPGSQSELEEERSEEVVSGIFSGPGTLTGFVVGGAGAVGKSAEQEFDKLRGRESGPGFGESLAGGGSRIAGQVAEDPGGFAAEETGEEIGEAVATGGIGLAAPTITPDPSLTVSTPESVETTARFVTGDLGPRVSQETVIEKPVEQTGVRTQIEAERFAEQGVDRKRVEEVTSIEEGSGIEREVVEVSNDKVVLGRRVEEPLTRREFLKERVDNSFVNPESNALGTGPGSLVPPEQTTDPSIDTTPESRRREELFDERPASRQTPESFDVPVSGLTQTPGTGVGLDEEQDFDNPLVNKEQVNEPVVEQDQKTDATVTPTFELKEEPFTGQIETFNEPTLSPTESNTPTPLFSPGFESDTEEGEEFVDRSFVETDEETEFAPSVAGQVFGVERRSEGEDPLFTGLEIRGVEENSSSENPGFEDSEFRF